MHVRPNRSTRPTLAMAALLAAATFAALPPAAGASSPSSVQAKGHLLGVGDMPAGWHTEKGSGGSGGGGKNTPGVRQLASCLGLSPRVLASNPPEVNSPYFENKAASLEVQDSVTTFSSSAKARTNFAPLNNPKVGPCMAQAFNSPAFRSQIASSAKGATIGTFTGTDIPEGALGKGVAGVVIAVPISSQGVTLKTQFTLTFFIKGSLGGEVDFYAYGSPFPTSLARSLIAKAASRL
jgi:hypothetical protein